MMKTILSLLLVVWSLQAVAQTTIPPTPPAATAPFPKSNILVVLTTDSAATAWKNMRQLLLEQGYALEPSPTDLLAFSTTPKAPDRKTNVALKINGYVKPTDSGSAIYLSGNWSTTVSMGLYGGTSVDGEAVFAGMEGGGNKKTFRAVEKLALAYPNGAVRYGAR